MSRVRRPWSPALTKQIEDLSPGDQMAVVAFSGSGLEVLSDWTADRERLAAVLAAVRKRPSDGIRLDVSELPDAAADVPRIHRGDPQISISM